MKSPSSFSRLCVLFLLILFGSALVKAQEQYAAVKIWESFDLSARTITLAQIGSLSVNDLKLVRGIIFGKHGRVFKDPDIKRYLQSRGWYHADPGFNNSALSDIERKNLD